MNGSINFNDAPDPLKTHCPKCGRSRVFNKSELKDKGVKPNAALPDLIHGLGRFIDCELASKDNVDMYNRCGLRYEDLKGR